MSSPLLTSSDCLAPTLGKQLPARMRVLFITGLHRTGSWLAEAFAADSASEIFLEEAVGMVAGLTRLRDEVFDAILVSHETGDLDALELLEVFRTGSRPEQPIIVLGNQSEQEMADFCFEVGADAYICVNSTTTRTLIWHLARAIERHELLVDNHRLRGEQRHRQQLEHNEAARLLTQQRALVDDPSADTELDVTKPADYGLESEELPQALVGHYRELLRAFVIMGTGSLLDDMNRLAGMLVAGRFTSEQTMCLHLTVVEEMVRDLGNRSARHVMNRANLLALEMMMNLAAGYRRNYNELLNPSRQTLLPGFEDAVALRFGP